MVPYLAESAVLYSTPLQNSIFSVETRRFLAGSLLFSLCIVGLLYIVFSAAALCFPLKRVPARRRVAFYILTVIIFAAFAVQYYRPEYQVLNFASAISLLLMYVAMQSSAEISDPLTKAYNYTAFLTIVSEYLERKKHFFILGYSVNELRRINKIYGEQRGNELLKRIAHTLGEAGEVARIYGNDFYVLLKDAANIESAVEYADSLPSAWSSESYEIPVGASKVILDSADFGSGEFLLEFMEFTVRTCKEQGEVQTLAVNNEHIRKYHRREQVKAAVARAVREDGINVAYQPIVDAYSGHVVAAEALARITDPELGVIPPGEFITVAEQSGLILELGKRVREKVWRLLSEYNIRGAGINHISVNLSSIECVQMAVMEDILKEAEFYGVTPGSIAFEVTETAAVSSKDILAFNLNMMRTKGFEFHLDDYGTGYSSMTSLISLPFSVIKFDKSIMRLAMEPQRGDLVKSTIYPMHGYGVKVVLEGIETEEQAEKARTWGVDYLQGFLYSEPLFKTAFLEYACISKIEKKVLQMI